MYTSIFNRLWGIARYWSEIATFSYPPLNLTPPYGRGLDCKIPTGSHSTGAPNRGGVYQKFAIFNQYFKNTDTEYRTNMTKIPTKIPNTDTDSKYRYRPSSSKHQPTNQPTNNVVYVCRKDTKIEVRIRSQFDVDVWITAKSDPGRTDHTRHAALGTSVMASHRRTSSKTSDGCC